jgi:hypothetical protein
MIKLLAMFAALVAWGAPGSSFVLVRRDVELFMTEVARFCVTEPDAKIERAVGGLRVTDVPGCVSELKTVAKAWNRTTKREPVAAASVLPERLELTRKALSEEFQGVKYAVDTRSCHCLVFQGPKAREWATAAQAIAVER